MDYYLAYITAYSAYRSLLSRQTCFLTKKCSSFFNWLFGCDNWKDAKQEVLTEDMDPQFIESIIFDKHLYKYEILDRKNCVIKIMKQQVSLPPSLIHVALLFLVVTWILNIYLSLIL